MSSIVKMTNLPERFHEGHIKQFFRHLTIVPNGVYIMKKRKGTAFVIFETHYDAKLSTWRNNDQVFENRIKISLSTIDELNRFLDEETES